jgi:hypothetical protein
MTRADVNTDITNKITSKTVAGSLTNTDDGANRVLMMDYVDQQVDWKTYKAKLSNPSNITATVLKNDTGKTFTYTRNSTGSYNFNFSSLYSDLSKIDIFIHLQSGSFVAPQVLIDNLGIVATIETKYWNGSNFVLADGILENATIYLIVNN